MTPVGPKLGGSGTKLGGVEGKLASLAINPAGGYSRATAIADPRTEKYQRLDTRLEKAPFDPAVPYFLDEEGAVHSVTGPHSRGVDTTPQSEERRRRWWRLWR